MNVSQERNMFPIRLTDALVSSLHFSKTEEHELAWVSGMINMGSGADSPADEAATAVAAQATLEPLPRKEMVGHTAKFVCEGQPRLMELIEVLRDAGINAEWW